MHTPPLPPNGSPHRLAARAIGAPEYLLDAHPHHLLHEVHSEDSIPIAQEITGRRLPREGLAQLLHGPFRCRTNRDAKMQNAPPLMRQHHKHIQDLEPNRGYRKKSTETMEFTWLSRKVRQLWEGGSWRRTRYLLTLVSPMSMPSLSNSP
jgi:hypothetical protein